MEILDQLEEEKNWTTFLEYKIERHHLSQFDKKELETYIREKRFVELLKQLRQEEILLPIPEKKEINKVGVKKKRVVYSFPFDFNMILKIIAFSLSKYDNLFEDNCYAFRKEYGVRDAMKRIRRIYNVSEKYCLKVDISNYFNSIQVPLLLEKLQFLKKEDSRLFSFFERLLTADVSVVEKRVLEEKRGAMAGIPVAPFFANVYLMDVDSFFAERGDLYFRYSDDILLFADTLEELKELQDLLYKKIKEHSLSLNTKKVKISKPGETWEFLGFCYRDGKIDLSENTIKKMKGKIKRKAHALRRWQNKKGLSEDKAAKGFIRAMNYKFFDDKSGTDFSWSRWFFPNITTDKGLREIDEYMQQYIRYCVTGRHYKGNYKITYEQMKEWGYRNLVHAYYAGKSK